MAQIEDLYDKFMVGYKACKDQDDSKKFIAGWNCLSESHIALLSCSYCYINRIKWTNVGPYLSKRILKYLAVQIGGLPVGCNGMFFVWPYSRFLLRIIRIFVWSYSRFLLRIIRTWNCFYLLVY